MTDKPARPCRDTHLSSLDTYCPGDSILHLMDARVKLVLTVLFVLAASFMEVGAWPAYVLLTALALAAAMASELGLGFVFRRASLAFPFVVAAVPLVFVVPGQSVATLSVGRWTLSVTGAGIERFLSIALKSWLSVQVAVVLTATTSLPSLLVAMRSLQLPSMLVSMVGLMWRYLYVLADEALRMMRARDSRSGAMGNRGGGSLLWRAQVTGSMAGSLFLRGYERSERIYNAMLARGYDGQIRSLPSPPLERRDWYLIGAGASVLFVVVLLSFWVG